MRWRMHAGIVREQIKDVLAGNKPESSSEAKQKLPWVSEQERVAYSLLAYCLQGLYLVRKILPESTRDLLFSHVRDIKLDRVPPSVLRRYELPRGPTISGSDFELYVLRAKKPELPHLGITVQKSLDNASVTMENTRGGYDLHKKLLPEFVSWQAIQLRDLGGKKEHLIRVSEYVDILADISVGQSEKRISAMETIVLGSPRQTQEAFVRLVGEIENLQNRGIYLDIGGNDNIVICRVNGTEAPVIRVLDTGLIGISDEVSPEDSELIRSSGIKIAPVTEAGTQGSWRAVKYRTYVHRLKEITTKIH